MGLVPEHSASVLLVEDDKDIRDAVSAVLEAGGLHRPLRWPGMVKKRSRSWSGGSLASSSST